MEKVSHKIRPANDGVSERQSHRTWLRDIGRGGDYSFISWNARVSKGEDDEQFPTVDTCSLEIGMGDCDNKISFEFYVSEDKHWKEAQDMLDTLLDEITKAKLCLYNYTKRCDFNEQEGNK